MEEQRQFNREIIVFSTKSVGTVGYAMKERKKEKKKGGERLSIVTI